MDIKICRFKMIGDRRGSLVALETGKNIPFTIGRVYYIFNTKKGVVRGKHAHKRLEQVLVCVRGSCKILVDDNRHKKTVRLSKPTQGLYIGPNIWRELFNFSSNCVVVVLASDPYNTRDYIRNYEKFRRMVTWTK